MSRTRVFNKQWEVIYDSDVNNESLSEFLERGNPVVVESDNARWSGRVE